MKALTVQQPWAWAIIHGGKDVENRTQAWKYRGPLAIHAGTRWSDRGQGSALVANAALHHGPAADYDLGSTWAYERERTYRTGVLIGVVDLVGVHYADPGGCCDSPWAETSYVEHGGKTRRQLTHLELRNPRPLPEPIRMPGKLGLWETGLDL